jgi:hypothetical protein
MHIPLELKHHVYNWADAHPLEAIHVDCATTVMLKILDGKCKMKPESKVVMELLYDAVKWRDGKLLDDDIHGLIKTARYELTEAMKNNIYEQRLMAETMISRPVMKAFKAMIKKEGLLDSSAMAGLQLDE